MKIILKIPAWLVVAVLIVNYVLVGIWTTTYCFKYRVPHWRIIDHNTANDRAVGAGLLWPLYWSSVGFDRIMTKLWGE